MSLKVVYTKTANNVIFLLKRPKTFFSFEILITFAKTY